MVAKCTRGKENILTWPRGDKVGGLRNLAWLCLPDMLTGEAALSGGMCQSRTLTLSSLMVCVPLTAGQ